MDRLEKIKMHGYELPEDTVWAISEIERLKKEKEWLLNECAMQYVFEGKMKATATMEEAKRWLVNNMQQALKERQ